MPSLNETAKKLVAPGMGINAFFTYSIVLGQKVPWPTALGIVFWAGVVFLLVSVTPLREAIARALPASLRSAAGAGIGVFLTFIGLSVDHDTDTNYFLDATLAYRRACLNAVEYLKRFGYSGEQAYLLPGSAPIRKDRSILRVSMGRCFR